MAKIKYTVSVEEYICTALQDIRTMHETRDYSRLMARVEHIQYHANRMEDAISSALKAKYQIRRTLEDKKTKPEDFMKEVRRLMKKEDD